MKRLSDVQSSARSAKSKKSSTWKKRIFRLNVFPGEYAYEGEINFLSQDEERDGESRDVRHLHTRIDDLDGALQQSQSTLHQSKTALQQSQSALITANAELLKKQSNIDDLAERNVNLANRLTAAEAEANEKTQSCEELQNRLKTLEKEKTTTEAGEVLGRKPLSELGRSQITATKKAYREKFREQIDTFGSNRRLVMESLTLRDGDGERLVVNAEPPRMYKDLLPAEKKRVARTSQWKDLNRVGDRVYSSIPSDGSLPPATHVKSYETELNESLPPIHEVSHERNWSMMN